MLTEIIKANKFLLIAFVAVVGYGAYYWWPEEGNNTPRELTDYETNLGSQLNQPASSEPSSTRGNRDGDVRGISIGGGGSSQADPTVYETKPPILEGYVAGYGTKTDGGREYWILLVATPQLDINGYEVDLRDMIGYREVDQTRWREGEFVRIYGTLESETLVRARAVQ